MTKPTANTVILATTAAVVVAVAGFAAAVSYSHIYDLARTYGQPITDARILPLSVDGPIVSASLVQLRQAKAGPESERAKKPQVKS